MPISLGFTGSWIKSVLAVLSLRHLIIFKSVYADGLFQISGALYTIAKIVSKHIRRAAKPDFRARLLVSFPTIQAFSKNSVSYIKPVALKYFLIFVIPACC